jgi:predicted transcriptional regulator of viral defense system
MANDLSKSLKNRLFSYGEAREAGVTRHELRMLLKNGLIEQPTRGVYKDVHAILDDAQLFVSASIRVGNPSAICLISALSYYGVTDEIPNKTWIMTPFEKRSRFADLRLFRARNPHWEVGIEQQDGFRITSLDRTLIDCLTHRSQVGSQLGIQALKTAILQKRTKLRDIAEMARQLGVFSRIKGIIEAVG